MRLRRRKEEGEEGEEVNEEVLAVGWRSVHHHVERPA